VTEVSLCTTLNVDSGIVKIEPPSAIMRRLLIITGNLPDLSLETTVVFVLSRGAAGSSGTLVG